MWAAFCGASSSWLQRFIEHEQYGAVVLWQECVWVFRISQNREETVVRSYKDSVCINHAFVWLNSVEMARVVSRLEWDKRVYCYDYLP